MELSVFLAKVLGLYLVIVAPAALLNRKHFPRLIKEFSDSLAMVVLSGFVALVLGLLLVVSHNVWTADWRVIITLLGWVTLRSSKGWSGSRSRTRCHGCRRRRRAVGGLLYSSRSSSSAFT